MKRVEEETKNFVLNHKNNRYLHLEKSPDKLAIICIILQDYFNYHLINAHHEGTMFCSLEHHMKTASPTYKEIIAKGIEIVPDILVYLRDTEHAGMNIMMLLTDILQYSPYTPDKIVSPSGEVIEDFVGFNVEEYKKAWIKYGKENGFID